MKELSFEEEKLNVKYAGLSSEMRYPSHDEEIEFLAAHEKEGLTIDEMKGLTKDFVLQLGMSEELYKKLPTKHLKQVLVVLRGGDEKN